MLSRFPSVPGPVVGLAFLAPIALAQDAPPPPMHAVADEGVASGHIEVPGFWPGLKVAVVHGDPSVPDQPYTLRLLFPDGYRFPPHWHPRAENVTVLEGTFRLAIGRSFDATKLQTYRPGDYLFIAAENPHYGGVRGRTVLQLHGIGPFEIHVVEGQEMSSASR